MKHVFSIILDLKGKKLTIEGECKDHSHESIWFLWSSSKIKWLSWNESQNSQQFNTAAYNVLIHKSNKKKLSRACFT